MSRWVLQEKLVSVHETFFDGIEQWPKAFVSVMNGAHTGKVVIRLPKAFRLVEVMKFTA
jgi:NADPH-dependent curcumin reductase CurA